MDWLWQGPNVFRLDYQDHPSFPQVCCQRALGRSKERVQIVNETAEKFAVVVEIAEVRVDSTGQA